MLSGGEYTPLWRNKANLAPVTVEVEQLKQLTGSAIA